MQCNKDNQLTWLKRDHIQFLFFFFFFLCFCVFHLNLKLVLPRPNVTHLLPGIQILDAPIIFSKFQNLKIKGLHLTRSHPKEKDHK
uniref:Uncharacterized protein n=1 Tax=Brassica campestris TaxID=3711 RepID=A0A3P5ZXZ5_BRACM|nr:unnamed protein product [Brassica rapa]